MGGTIRARVRGGVLEPVDKIDLPEGKEVTITIFGLSAGYDPDAFLRSRGGWKGLVAAASRRGPSYVCEPCLPDRHRLGDLAE